MSIRTTVVGSYPKVIEGGADNLPGTIDRWQRQILSGQQLDEEIQKVIRRVIGEQEQAGLDLVTDGQIRWEDLAHPLTRSVRGLNRGALRRFFDNNVYYRRLELPEGNGGLQWQKSSVAEEFQSASRVARRPVKVALPGPLTLVVFTEIPQGQTLEGLTPSGLLSLYADLLRQEVQALEKAGVKEIQIDEPAFKAGEPLLDAAVESVNRIFEGVKARRWVACYFHDLSPILPALGRLRVDLLSLDLVTGPKVADRLKELKWDGEIALGLLDGRNTKLEPAEEIVSQVKRAAAAIPLNRLWVSPNCGLEFLPHEAAVKKLNLLQEIKEGI
ncbi:MAG: hypothetical protein HYZ93_06240 [Candidatus Omnitrophica bacterium]|nr:hypothetical protein [Candidatus Omnitrophota bacterium]